MSIMEIVVVYEFILSLLWFVVEKFFAIRKMRRVLERKDVGLGAPARTRPSEQRS